MARRSGWGELRVAFWARTSVNRCAMGGSASGLGFRWSTGRGRQLRFAVAGFSGNQNAPFCPDWLAGISVEANRNFEEGHVDVCDGRSYPWPMADPQGGTTFRPSRGSRAIAYGFLGFLLAICTGLAISSLASAHSVASRDGDSTARFDVEAVSTAVVAMTLATVLVLLCAPMFLGKTTLRMDGLLIAKPCRRRRLVTWSEIDSMRVDAVNGGRGSPNMGLRVVAGGKGFFLPGLVDPHPDFEERVNAVEAAWQSIHPPAVSKKTNNKARRRRRS
jgi:hypothetical protein